MTSTSRGWISSRLMRSSLSSLDAAEVEQVGPGDQLVARGDLDGDALGQLLGLVARLGRLGEQDGPGDRGLQLAEAAARCTGSSRPRPRTMSRGRPASSSGEPAVVGQRDGVDVDRLPRCRGSTGRTARPPRTGPSCGRRSCGPAGRSRRPGRRWCRWRRRSMTRRRWSTRGRRSGRRWSPRGRRRSPRSAAGRSGRRRGGARGLAGRDGAPPHRIPGPATRQRARGRGGAWRRAGGLGVRWRDAAALAALDRCVRGGGGGRGLSTPDRGGRDDDAAGRVGGGPGEGRATRGGGQPGDRRGGLADAAAAGLDDGGGHGGGAAGAARADRRRRGDRQVPHLLRPGGGRAGAVDGRQPARPGAVGEPSGST
jgi:hypothetical protein